MHTSEYPQPGDTTDHSLVGESGLRTATTATGDSGAGFASNTPRVRERRPVDGVSLAMAEAVTRSWKIPQYVQLTLIDASGMAARRKMLGPELKEKYGIDLTYTDLIVDAVARAAKDVPEANSTFMGDTILLYEDVNISMAVANDEGLPVTPVIPRTQELSFAEIVVRTHEIVARAKAGLLTKEENEGGTISIANLGMFGVEQSTPMLVPPQSVLVYLGAIKDRPVVVEGEIVVRPAFYMSTTFDHRVLPAVTAARFTGAMKRNLEAF